MNVLQDHAISGALFFPLQTTIFPAKTSQNRFLPIIIHDSVSLSELTNRDEDGRLLPGKKRQAPDFEQLRKWRSLSGVNSIDRSTEPDFIKQWKLKQAGYGFLQALKRKRIRVGKAGALLGLICVTMNT